MTPRGTPRILRSESSQAEQRLRVFVAEEKASDLFWLEMVFKGSRIPFCIEAVTDKLVAARYLAQATADLIFVDDAAMLGLSAGPSFVLGNADERERCADPRRFIEKPFTNEKLFECLAAADLGAWTARVVPV